MTEIKTCLKCGNKYPETAEYFKIHSSTKKFGNVCKKCIAQKAKEYYTKNQEKIKQDARNNYYENREARLEGKKEYYQKNKERIDNYKRQWERDNKERIATQKKEWKEKNPEKHRQRLERYYENYKEILAERRRKYYEENREKILAQKKKYHALNKGSILAYKEAYYEQNVEKIKRTKKLYRINNKQKIRFHQRKRYLAKKGLPATLTLEEWELIKSKFENRCCYCDRELPLEQDHFIALTKGGWYVFENIVPACKRCNSSKKTKSLSEWYPKQKFYSQERETKILEHVNTTANEKI